MFIFGSPEESARTLLESIQGTLSESLVDLPIDEMTVEQMRVSLIHFQTAIKMAREEGVSEETLTVLLEWHDELVQELAEVDEKFNNFLARGRFRYPRERSSYNTGYYQAMVRKPSGS